MEANNIGLLASPKALLELKANIFVRHYLNGNWVKADNDKFDIKWLVRTYGLRELKIV